MADYNIGDTIRLKATIKNFNDVETAPAAINVSVYKLDGTTLLTSTGGIPTLSSGTTAQYYYDWTVSTGLTATTKLMALWQWTGPHKKRMNFNVVPMI